MTPEPEITDEALMEAVGRGEESAFGRLVDRYQNIVYGTCFRMLGSYRSEAEDVAQMVFIKVYKAAPRYRPTAQFKTWLMTIVRHTVFSHIKKMKRHSERRADLQDVNNPEAEVEYRDDEMSTAADHAEQRELVKCLEVSMASLPENQRMALVLRQYEQMDYESIAQALGTSVSSVKSLIFRARATLREAVREHREK